MRYSILLLLLVACNPVKQVLKDKNKLDQVAEVVVKSGYCANDTTIITKSDTTFQVDTIYDTEIIIDEVTKKDTLYVRVPKIIVRTTTIRDTITNVVVDGARVLLLEKEVIKYKTKADDLKELAKARWWYLFWLILFIVTYILRKPILKLCLPMFR